MALILYIKTSLSLLGRKKMETLMLQKAYILTALEKNPLDRVRLMKTMFLVWHRSGRPSTGPFSFEPYLYGPCAFDLYSALDKMELEGLLIQAPHPINRWAPYHLTDAGKTFLKSMKVIDAATKKVIREVADWAAGQSFHSLLDSVYREAPDFATRSVFRMA